MKKFLTAFVLLSLFNAKASTDYAPAIYREAYPGHWYTSGNGHKFAVIHDMEGYYLSTISYFQQECQGTNPDGSCRGKASAHYCVNGLKDYTSDAERGEITQMVRESYYAWHALCWNTHSLGTEHEGFVSNPAWYTEEMYRASAALQRHLADKFGFPKDRNHIVGHDEKRNAAWVAYASANLGIDPTCNTHTDPGQYWNWSHFMALVIGGPAAPTNLVLTPLNSSQIRVEWTDLATNESGFKIERATSASGPWTQIGSAGANITTMTSSGLTGSTVYYFRVKAFNANGDSEYSEIESATTGNAAPVLAAIGNKYAVEGSLLTFNTAAIDAGFGASTLLTDFEGYSSGSTSVLFQKPGYSGSTRGLDAAVTNYSAISSTFPLGAEKGLSVLKASWGFSVGAANWVRLTTAGVTTFPRPVIDLRQILKFDIYSDKALKVAICASETGNPAGTAIGSDGGSSTSFEWAGVTNKNDTAPMPTRTIPANTWTTVQFNLPLEPITPFALADANGILSTPTGLGALEHVALVPVSTAAGTYTVYMDNFSVVNPDVLTFSLDPGAPTGASIDPNTGVFAWTPTEAQGPGIYDITIRVTDNGTPALSDFETISVTVAETNNFAPTLAPIPDKIIAAGETLTFTNSASDGDSPLDLAFSLNPGAPADAQIDPTTGIFSWATSARAPDSTNSITVVVSDSGVPEKIASRTFLARVVSRTVKVSQIDANGNLQISWNTIAGRKYRVQFKNNLSDENWTDIAPDIISDGSPAIQNVSTESGAQRFYRIVDIP
jgi:N-acetyl-anhydromuramyl-L-alanine amidase AmpD